MKTCRVLVFGGNSTECDVSVLTAFQILKLSGDMNLVPVFLCENNKFWVLKKQRMTAIPFFNFGKNKHLFQEIMFFNGRMFQVQSSTKNKCISIVDCAINCCHGGFGENGGLSEYLFGCDIPCTSGFGAGLGVAMNKILFKATARGFDLPVIDGFGITRNEYENNRHNIRKQVLKFGFPQIIKPANGGSSVGVSLVKRACDFEKALSYAFEFDDSVLVEHALTEFEEYNCSVIFDGRVAEVSDIEKPTKSGLILSFDDKYGRMGKGEKSGAKLSKGMVSLSREFPAKIDDALKNRIQLIARNIVERLQIFGVVRIDFLFDGQNIFLNELNSVPGSLAFYFWKMQYFDIDFIKKLIKIAEIQFKKRKSIVLKESIFSSK